MAMNNSIFKAVIFATFLLNMNLCFANDPVLHFTDIESGPSQGLNDGKGAGAIVTVWGNYLGEDQLSSSIVFKDANNTEHQPAYIYYWKNADGALPGGPSDLYSSHKMQEIAFSVPNAALGTGEFFITVNGKKSNSLPFTLTNTGNIYWVAPSGNNSNSCSYTSPCNYLNADINSGAKGGLANGRLSEGDIVYSRGVDEPELCSGGRCVSLFTRSINGTSENPISFIAYPGTQPTAISKDQGLVPYFSDFISVSKYTIKVGHRDPSLSPDPGNSAESDIHIQVRRGRYIGNYLGQNADTCITGWGGSITSSNNGGDGMKFYGNEIDGLGCPNTSRFQHTTYLSVRSTARVLTEGWDVSYNYLHDNYAMNGLHFYDEIISGSGDCGTFTGTIKASHNVISNQWGLGINISSRDTAGVSNKCWEADIEIYNNVLMGVGKGEILEDGVVPSPSAISVGGNIAPSYINIHNNTIVDWGGSTGIASYGDAYCMKVTHFNPLDTTIRIQNNICKSNVDSPYFYSDEIIDETDNNIFFTSALNPKNDTKPNWSSIISTNPQLKINGNLVTLDALSPARGAGFSITNLEIDIYGLKRGSSIDIGAIEYFIQPNPPSNVKVQQ